MTADDLHTQLTSVASRAAARITTDTPIEAAVREWRTAELHAETEQDEHDAIGRLRDIADRWLGRGLGAGR